MGMPVTFISLKGPIPIPREVMAALSMVGISAMPSSKNARRLIQPGDKEPVDSKPGSVFDQDVCFSRELGKLPAG